MRFSSKSLRYSIKDMDKEVKQAVEGMYHNLNTLQSRSGNQLPFTSVNYGACTSREGQCVDKALLEASLDGVGKFHRTSIFPCGIFQYKKGVNDKPGTLNYDLKRLALKSTSKRLYPNYANGDWSVHLNQVKKDRDLKNKVLSNLPPEKYDKLVSVLKDNAYARELLYLNIDGDRLEVDMKEKPEESFSTMGALDGKEKLYVRFDKCDPVELSIKDLFSICIGEEDGEYHKSRHHYPSERMNIPSRKVDRDLVDNVSKLGDGKSGVYRITYIPEDISYIGSCVDIKVRLAEHENNIKLYGCLDVGLDFRDYDINNYRFEVLEYTNRYKIAESRYIFREEVPRYCNVSNHFHKDNNNWCIVKDRPKFIMDKSISQDYISLLDKDIKVLDRDNTWVKVNHIYRNDEMNTPYMMHVIYKDGDNTYTLCCTEDHPLWTGTEFTNASNLKAGDHIFRSDNKELEVVDVQWRAFRSESYDIGTVTGSFIGSDIIMHNCRTMLGDDINFDENYYEMLIDRVIEGKSIENYILSKAQKDGRGNLAPVTLILPTLAMQAVGEVGNKDIDDFMFILETKLHEAKDMLVERYEWMCSQNMESAKFMYENHVMAGYVPEEGIESALKHGTLAIGQLGLAECLQILVGCDHTEERGMEVAKRIESYINKTVSMFKETYKLNFGVYFTPAENLAYKAMKKFKEAYGEIPNVSDREYFTNSIHVPVWKNMSPFDKIDIESQLTGFSNAGCITYVEVDGSTFNNIDALEQIVDYAMQKDVPYFAINCPCDLCKTCGYQGDFNDRCTECGSTDIEQLRRVTGYLTGNFRTAFNKGKQAEVKDRVRHINKFTSLDGTCIDS